MLRLAGFDFQIKYTLLIRQNEAGILDLNKAPSVTGDLR